MRRLYSTIGDVQSVLEQCYRDYGMRASFPYALEYLQAHGRLMDARPEVPNFYTPLDAPAFDALVKGLPVDAIQIMVDAIHVTEGAGRFVITEDKAIPDDKDVFIIKHLPYVDDGLHGHNYFEINYLYSGSCVQLFENERRTLYAGDMCIISPYAQHNIILDSSCFALGILMRKSTFDRIFWELLTQKDLLSAFFRHSLYEVEQSNYLFLQTDNRTEIQYLLQNIVLETHLSDSYANHNAINLMNVLFGKILRSYSKTIQFYDMKPRLHHELEFSMLLQYVQQNYQTVTLQGLAQQFHFSEAHLSRRFKQNIGKGFSALIQEFKLNRAAESLRNTTMKVSEISEMVGYDSVDHFSRSFKKYFGASPLAYRKSRQRD